MKNYWYWQNNVYFGGFIGWEKTVANLFLFVMPSGFLHVGVRVTF
jgi:hypothetical protein